MPVPLYGIRNKEAIHSLQMLATKYNPAFRDACEGVL